MHVPLQGNWWAAALAYVSEPGERKTVVIPKSGMDTGTIIILGSVALVGTVVLMGALKK